MPKQNKYWYEFFHYYCPLCGRVDTYKIRNYTNKPKEHEKRHHWKEQWDYCEALNGIICVGP